jgi:hypothetical protein
MNFDLNEMLVDVMHRLSEDRQDMLSMLFQTGIIVPSDTVEKALIKIDERGDDYHVNIMDDIMGEIANNDTSMPDVTIIDNDTPSPYSGQPMFTHVKQEDTTPTPEPMGISIQDLMDSASEEDAVEMDYLTAKHFMGPSADVTDLIIKLNTLLNPQMDSMGSTQDISVGYDDDVNDVLGLSVGNLTPEQQHGHNVKMRCTLGLELIDRLLNQRNNPEQSKFIEFLSNLKDSHDNDLINIVENGFKLIHKECK